MSSAPRPATAGSARPPRRRARLLVLVLAVLLLAVVALLGRKAAQRHLGEMLRQPEAGLGACLDCHGPGREPRPLPRDAPGPLSLVVLPDGELLVTAERDDSLYRLDGERGGVRGRIDVGRRPHGVAVLADLGLALVTLRGEDVLAVVDLERGEVTARIPVGREPTGLAAVPRHGQVLVANTGSDDVSVVDVRQRRELYRLTAGREPFAVAVAPDGKVALVANRLANPHPPREVPRSEVTVISLTAKPRVTGRRMLESLHLAEGIAFTPDGSMALLGAVATKNLIPTSQANRGWITSDALVVLELGGQGRTVPVLIDDAHDFQADPAEVVVSPDGKLALLSIGGRDRVLGVDLARLRGLLERSSAAELEPLGTVLGPGSAFVSLRLSTRAHPRGLACSADGSRLYVAEHLADAIAVFALPDGRLLGRTEIGLPGPPSPRLRGERLFNRAVAYQGQFSCRSCHPDGHLDGLVYDFEIDGIAENLLDNRSLRGLKGTEPYKWTGLNPSIEVQCGPRFMKVLGRSTGFLPDELQMLSQYLESIPTVNGRRPVPLTGMARLGRQIFYRERTNDGRIIPVKDRCPSCHPAPAFTSQARARVGTGADSDYTDVFDASHLLDLRDGAPYLHDGRAGTLYELLIRHNAEDRHGRTRDLTRVQLAALVAYLRTL